MATPTSHSDMSPGIPARLGADGPAGLKQLGSAQAVGRRCHGARHAGGRIPGPQNGGPKVRTNAGSRAIPAAAQRHSSAAERIPCASRNQAGAEKQKSKPMTVSGSSKTSSTSRAVVEARSRPVSSATSRPSCATASQMARAAARRPAAPLQSTPTQRRGPTGLGGACGRLARELEQDHLGGVTLTRAELERARVPAVDVREGRSDLVE